MYKCSLVPVLSLLKSDHFGIEIKGKHEPCTITTMLKSDHFGIEMSELHPIWEKEMK